MWSPDAAGSEGRLPAGGDQLAGLCRLDPALSPHLPPPCVARKRPLGLSLGSLPGPLDTQPREGPHGAGSAGGRACWKVPL